MSKGKNKHLIKSSVPQYDPSNKKVTTYLNSDVSKLHSLEEDGDKAHVFISLRFVEYQHQCFSDWDKKQMKAFWEFQEKAHNYTWEQVKAQATKDLSNKTGLGYTQLPPNTYPPSGIRQKLSPDTTFFELRVSGEMRVHGFRSKSIFYICWLDKGHDYCS